MTDDGDKEHGDFDIVTTGQSVPKTDEEIAKAVLFWRTALGKTRARGDQHGLNVWRNSLTREGLEAHFEEWEFVALATGPSSS